MLAITARSRNCSQVLGQPFRLALSQLLALAEFGRYLAIHLAVAILCSAALGQNDTSTLIHGIVRNEMGKPVHNARVDISTAAPILGPAVFCPSCYLDCQKWTTTDESGQFKLTDLASRLKFRLVISAVGYKTAQTDLIPTGKKSHDLTLRDRPKTGDYQRTVQGLVRNEIGIAVQGALVSPFETINKKGLRSSSTENVSPAVTDATGHFEIDLVESVSGIDIEIAADGLCNRRFVELKPSDPLEIFELLEGARIVGSVYSMGRPVSGMTISVAQTDHSYRGEKFFLKAIPTVTDTQGQFELKNLLPDQEYCVYSVIGEADRANSPEIIKTQKFIAPSSGKYLDIGRLATVQPVSFSGRLIRSDGEPVDVLALLFNRDPAWDLIKVPVATDGSFRIDGLPPEVYEISLANNQFDLDADRIDSLLWTEKSIKRLIDKSINDVVLPIRQIERGNPDLARTGTQVLAGRVILTKEDGISGIIISANDGNEPKTSTAKDGYFTLNVPKTAAWLKLYRPDKDGIRFWYLGRVKPNRTKNITIRLGPETTYELESVSGRGK